MNFKQLSEDIYYKSSHYRFSKKPSSYEKGYIKIADWLNELCYHYISQQKELSKANEDEFKHLVDIQRMKIENLAPSEYKQGLLKALDEAL